MYLAPIISQHLDILYQPQRLGFLANEIKGQCKKNDINQKFRAHLKSVMVSGLHENFVEIYRDMRDPHLTFCIISKLKSVFSAPLLTTHKPNNLHSVTYYENNVQSLISFCKI